LRRPWAMPGTNRFWNGPMGWQICRAS